MYDEAEYGGTLKSWVVPTYMLCAYIIFSDDNVTVVAAWKMLLAEFHENRLGID